MALLQKKTLNESAELALPESKSRELVYLKAVLPNKATVLEQGNYSDIKWLKDSAKISVSVVNGKLTFVTDSKTIAEVKLNGMEPEKAAAPLAKVLCNFLGKN